MSDQVIYEQVVNGVKIKVVVRPSYGLFVSDRQKKLASVVQSTVQLQSSLRVDQEVFRRMSAGGVKEFRIVINDANYGTLGGVAAVNGKNGDKIISVRMSAAQHYFQLNGGNTYFPTTSPGASRAENSVYRFLADEKGNGLFMAAKWGNPRPGSQAQWTSEWGSIAVSNTYTDAARLPRRKLVPLGIVTSEETFGSIHRNIKTGSGSMVEPRSVDPAAPMDAMEFGTGWMGALEQYLKLPSVVNGQSIDLPFAEGVYSAYLGYQTTDEQLQVVARDARQNSAAL